MDKPRKQSTCDRKGVQSLFIPAVPQIILNANEKADLNASCTMPHSRSAGELAMCMSSGSSGRTSPGSVILCNGRETESSSRNNIDIYCSPRLPRKCFPHRTPEHFNDGSNWMETCDSNNFPSKLNPGSRVGSALSLTSEYTSRSVGLISNDSSSDSTQFSDKLEQIKQKQNLLRRYVSNPEKPQNEIMETSVPRCTKSVNNLNNECSQQCFSLDQQSGSDDFPEVTFPEINRSMAAKVMGENDEFSSTLVTMVTDELALKEGRVRQWLTEIGTNNN